MALRNSPYLPLYVQDFMCDEKLAECSAAANGIYIRIMCIMHKQEPYGTIQIKRKDYVYYEGTEEVNLCASYSLKLARYLPYDYKTITEGLQELIEEGVLVFDGMTLVQKRMFKDGVLSMKRAESGRGKSKNEAKVSAKTLAKDTAKDTANSEANTPANSDIEIDIENDIKSDNENEKIEVEIKKFDYNKVVEKYNEICQSLPKKRKIAEQLKPKIKLRLDEMEKSIDIYKADLGSVTGEITAMDILALVCKKAEASTFIKEGTWFSFDWLFANDHNWIKVIEGQYDNKHSISGRNTAKEDRYREMEQGFFNILNG